MKIGGKCVHKQTESRSDIKERRKRADGTFSWKERMFKPKLNKEGVSLGGASSWGKKGKEQKTDHFPLLKWTLWFTAINRKNGGEVYFHCVHWWKKTGEKGGRKKKQKHTMKWYPPYLHWQYEYSQKMEQVTFAWCARRGMCVDQPSQMQGVRLEEKRRENIEVNVN